MHRERIVKSPALPRTRALFQRFPLALAVVDHAGATRALNARFTEQLDRTDVRSVLSPQAVMEPGWHEIQLTRPDGQRQVVYAKGFRVDEGVVVVFDELVPERSEDVARLRERVLDLERENATDALTGAWNRAHLDRVISTEIARSVRFRQPLSLVLVDLDHFKRVNDTHGHLVGDQTLVHLVGLIRSTIRSGDLVFRWGGEEFVVLTTSTGYRGAGTVAENLRRVVAAAMFPDVGTVTISVGVAEHLVDESPTAWFARADEMLYAAKRAGRDRVSVDPRGCSDLWAGSSVLRLVWQEDYECGEESIDRQHRQLFELANQTIETSLGDDPAACTLAMDRLMSEVEAHFAEEERILERARYPQLVTHRAAHCWLLSRARALRTAMAEDNVDVGAVVQFLARDLVSKHLLVTDRQFFPWLRQESTDQQPAST